MEENKHPRSLLICGSAERKKCVCVWVWMWVVDVMVCAVGGRERISFRVGLRDTVMDVILMVNASEMGCTVD